MIIMEHKGNGTLRNQRNKGDHPDYCIFKIDQNTKKSPRVRSGQ